MFVHFSKELLRHFGSQQPVAVLGKHRMVGLAAAVPMGPVNMLAIRRGVIGGWRHTLAAHTRPWFAPVRTKLETHLTPWGAPQSFQFSLFKRI